MPAARRRGERSTAAARRARLAVTLSRGSKSQIRERENRAVNAAPRNVAFTGRARSADFKSDNNAAMQEAWAKNTTVPTFTSTPDGKLSANGRNTTGALTHTYTNRDMEGNLVSQSGRSRIATRAQRNYDTRAGMNNISPRVIQAWLDNGMARVVNGRMEDAGGNVIRQKRDGNYTMGLSVG